MGRALTTKGISTRSLILEMAHEVFKEFGYYGASISEIARRCDISMGTIYQYFKNKEQIFLELNDSHISQFMQLTSALAIEALNFEERFRKALTLLYDHTRDHFAFHRILGESELIDRVTISYYESIARFFRDFLREEAQAGNIRGLDPNMVAYSLIGICYFHSLEWGGGDPQRSTDETVALIHDLVLYGINGPAPWYRPPHWDMFTLPEPKPESHGDGQRLTKGDKTKQQLLQAAESVFARHGFNRTSIAEITRKAGVAQGTFYVHFKSKNDLIEGFVKYISHKIRIFLQRYVAQTTDRRDGERVGYLAFFDFIRKHQGVYHLVPEAEMVSRQMSLWYYNRMAHGYARGLAEGVKKGEIRDMPIVFLARSLMGIVHIIGLKWILWDADPQAGISSQLFKDIMEFILFGLNPKK
jgi:AcrR family transcriptional regulator